MLAWTPHVGENRGGYTSPEQLLTSLSWQLQSDPKTRAQVRSWALYHFRWEKRISTVNSLKIQIHPKSDIFSCLLLRWVQQNDEGKAGMWMTRKCYSKMGRRTIWIVMCFKEKQFFKIIFYLVYIRLNFAFSRANWISISVKENGTWLLMQPHCSPTNENEFSFHQRGLH